jgi:iron-sulfur cluster repair protein YtfE (RIC family)
MLDALALLTADHNRVRGLFTRFTSAKEDGDTATIAELAAQIDTELEVHATIEEEIFYPWARRLSDEIAEVVDEGVEEHHVVKVLLGELRTLSPGDDEWVAKFTVVTENVEHHAEEEESEMFPQIRREADADALEGLAVDLEARKRDLGAPVLADKQDLSTRELRDLAKEQEIPGRSSMDHDELAATVSPG